MNSVSSLSDHVLFVSCSAGKLQFVKQKYCNIKERHGVVRMREIRSGRIKKSSGNLPDTDQDTPDKLTGKSHIADITAIICAVLCAVVLCIFGARGDTTSKDAVYQAVGSKTLGAITYNPPEQPQEWNFWDYFADVMAGVFGYTD